MKKTNTNVFTILLALVFSGITAFWSLQVAAEEWTSEQQEVWKSVKGHWDLIVKGVAAAIEAISAEGFLEWWPNDPKTFGKKYVKGKYERWLGGNKPVSYELKPVAIGIIGGIANVFYYYNWNGDKMPVTVSGRMYAIWIKQ